MNATQVSDELKEAFREALEANDEDKLLHLIQGAAQAFSPRPEVPLAGGNYSGILSSKMQILQIALGACAFVPGTMPMGTIGPAQPNNIEDFRRWTRNEIQSLMTWINEQWKVPQTGSSPSLLSIKKEESADGEDRGSARTEE